MSCVWLLWCEHAMLRSWLQFSRVLSCLVFLGSKFSLGFIVWLLFCSPVPALAIPELCFVSSPLLPLSAHSTGNSPLWRCVSTNVGTVGADLPTPYPLCLVEWLEAWSDWTPLPVTFLCPQLRLLALCPGRVLCSKTLINIWVEPAIESVFFPDNFIHKNMVNLWCLLTVFSDLQSDKEKSKIPSVKTFHSNVNKIKQEFWLCCVHNAYLIRQCLICIFKYNISENL